jgi:transcriptional regulator with XRE-family HTH domain
MSSAYLKNLKKLRKKKGWSQEKLARESGISYQTLIKIEQGRIKNPRLDTLIKLAKALGVSIDKLLGSSK